jgi:hypothetical protein
MTGGVPEGDAMSVVPGLRFHRSTVKQRRRRMNVFYI